MRYSKLSIALAGILSAGSALAVVPSTVPSGNRLYISGATATDITLSNLFLRAGTGSAPAICSGGTIDVYVESADLASSHNRLIACTLNQTISSGDGSATINAGQNIAVLKESNGGSDRGTNFVADSLGLDFRSFTLTGCTAGSTVTPGGTLQPYTLHTGCSAVENVHTELGVADVDPALFSVGTAPITPAQLGRLTSDALYQPMFAVAASLNLYRALQRAQGKTLDDTEANVPSLTRGQVRGLLSDGGLTDWSAITNSAGTAITDTSLTGGVALASTTVYVCRRGDESGTQASFAQYFLNERCATNPSVGFKNSNNSPQQTGQAFTPPTINGSGTVTNAGSTGLPVFANTATSDARTCLDGHNDVDHFAIGVLGSDSTYNAIGSLGGKANRADGDRQFRYLALDGQVPNLTSVANGKYDFVMENVLNRRNATAPNGDPVIGGGILAIADYIKDAFATPDVVASLLVKTNPHGYTGGLAGAYNAAGVAPNAPPVTTAKLDTNPVSAFTKSPLGPVNNCGTAVAVTPSDP
jgi:hypothetical protein